MCLILPFILSGRHIYAYNKEHIPGNSECYTPSCLLIALLLRVVMSYPLLKIGSVFYGCKVMLTVCFLCLILAFYIGHPFKLTGFQLFNFNHHYTGSFSWQTFSYFFWQMLGFGRYTRAHKKCQMEIGLNFATTGYAVINNLWLRHRTESRKVVNLPPDNNILEGKPSPQNDKKRAWLGCVIGASIGFRGPSSGQWPCHRNAFLTLT